jgi:hypothetical protein
MRRVKRSAVISLLLLSGACASSDQVSAPPPSPPSTAPSVQRQVCYPDVEACPNGVYASPVFTSESPPALEAVRVLKVAGLSTKRATAALEGSGLAVRIVQVKTSDYAPGTVIRMSPKGGARVDPGSTITLFVAVAPPHTTPPPPSNCDPNYAGQCLDPNAVDYDCAGGSGNGPKYVYGTVRVVGSDHYGLDSDGDGIGCE